MKRLLFLAYHFPPVGGGGVQRYVKFVRYLRDFGYDPVVVTGPGAADDRWTPTDSTLAQELGDVEIHRVPGPEPPIHRAGWAGRCERLLDLRSPYVSWWIEGAVQVGLAAAGDASLIFGGLVPYQTAEAAGRLSLELGIPWVADLQDPWALDEMWLYPTYLHRRRDEQRMRSVLASAAAIVMNTPEAVERVRRRFPELAPRLTPAIPNGLDPDDFAGIEALAHPDDAHFRIAHTGYLHTEQGLALRRTGRIRRLLGGMPVPSVDLLTRSHIFLVQAVDRLLAEEPELADVIEVHLAGVLSPLDREIAERTSYCRLHGYLSHDESVALLRSSQLLFLPMHDLPQGTRAGLVPGKTYEYLGAGRPILAAVPDGDARDILAAAGNATICRPADVDALSRGIRDQIDKWRSGTQRSAAQRDVVARFERRRLTEQLADVLAAAEGAGRTLQLLSS